MSNLYYVAPAKELTRKAGTELRALFCIREDYVTNPAGDSVQAVKTADYLRRRGISVDINNGSIKDYTQYDLVHLFNLTRIGETYRYFQTARRNHKTVVITPIYWDLGRYYRHTGNRDEIGLWEAYGPFRREILEGCAMIYPSSGMELALLKKEYGESLPFTIVNNGIDESDLPREADTQRGDCILCAARVCPRKNQLALAKACRELNIKLVLAGEAKNRAYLTQCLKYENTVYRGFLQPRELSRLYANAKLHVLCSYVETPGLSSLEAAACGCNILTTAEGSAKEYFEDMALYCDPYDESDLYAKIEAGLSFNRQPRLKAHILEKYSLSHCLGSLYGSYLSLLYRL